MSSSVEQEFADLYRQRAACVADVRRASHRLRKSVAHAVDPRRFIRKHTLWALVAAAAGGFLLAPRKKEQPEKKRGVFHTMTKLFPIAQSVIGAIASFRARRAAARKEAEEQARDQPADEDLEREENVRPFSTPNLDAAEKSPVTTAPAQYAGETSSDRTEKSREQLESGGAGI